MKLEINTEKGYLTGDEVMKLFQLMSANTELMEELEGQYGNGSMITTMFTDWGECFKPTAHWDFPKEEEED